MDAILQGIPQVACYINDIIVTGKDDNDHLSNLQQVFQRLQENGLRLKQSKCELMKDSIENILVTALMLRGYTQYPPR